MTRAEIESILAGTKGVTPGPWHFVEENAGLMPDHGYGLLHGHPEPGSGGWEKNLYISVGASTRATNALGEGAPEANAAHIARLDPQTVSALCTALLESMDRVGAVEKQLGVILEVENCPHPVGALASSPNPTSKRCWEAGDCGCVYGVAHELLSFDKSLGGSNER